jgi:predicted RNA binding protein YcfA (HicA-like mRNA interferase family)
MTHLPIVDFKTMEKVLIDLGFNNTRRNGSHFFYRHPDGRTTTLPNHPGRDLSRPLMREILREIETTPEDFLKALDNI